LEILAPYSTGTGTGNIDTRIEEEGRGGESPVWTRKAKGRKNQRISSKVEQVLAPVLGIIASGGGIF